MVSIEDNPFIDDIPKPPLTRQQLEYLALCQEALARETFFMAAEALEEKPLTLAERERVWQMLYRSTEMRTDNIYRNMLRDYPDREYFYDEERGIFYE